VRSNTLGAAAGRHSWTDIPGPGAEQDRLMATQVCEYGMKRTIVVYRANDDSAQYDEMHPHKCPSKDERDEMFAATPAQRWDLAFIGS
jgi:hypothetical protein